MYKGLINTLTYMYRFIAMGRGQLSKDEIESIGAGAHTLAGKAPQVLTNDGSQVTDDERLDLEEAVLVDQHISEMVQWLISLEIV